jgi:hypothetical protein
LNVGGRVLVLDDDEGIRELVNMASPTRAMRS